VSGGVPEDGAQVEAADGWIAGAAEDVAPAPSGQDVTAGTVFAPGAVQEAIDDARGPAEEKQ
jgi:hypothetical protein